MNGSPACIKDIPDAPGTIYISDPADSTQYPHPFAMASSVHAAPFRAAARHTINRVTAQRCVPGAPLRRHQDRRMPLPPPTATAPGLPSSAAGPVTDAAVPEGHAGLHGFLYGEGGAEAHDGGSSSYAVRQVRFGCYSLAGSHPL